MTHTPKFQVYIPTEKERRERRVLKELFDGCRAANMQQISAAIEKGADPNQSDPSTMQMAWSHLVRQALPEQDDKLAPCLKVLLENGMDPFKSGVSCKSLVWSLSREFAECALVLIDHYGEERVLEHKDAKQDLEWWSRVPELVAAHRANTLDEATPPSPRSSSRRM